MSNLLGEIVTWDLQAPECKYSEVVKALGDAGLNPDEAKELTPQSAFSRACKGLKENRQIDKLDAMDGKKTFQFTHKELKQERYEFDYECKLDLDLKTGDIICEIPELEQQAKDCYALANNVRTANDVTLIVQKMFKAHADLFPINPRKGVAYFVPDKHSDFTARVERFLKTLGGKLLRFPVPKGTPEGNASVRDAVQEGLSVLVDELNETVEEWGTNTRKATMEKSIAQWQAISYKVEAYDEYLGQEQEQLRSALAEAKRKLSEKISELKPDEALAV